MKYSSTLSPSRKLDFTGMPISRPFGSDIRPRIPAICLIWLMLPLAPDAAIKYVPPKLGISSSMISVTESLASVHTLMVWSYRS